MTGANPQAQPELRVVGHLQLLPGGEQTATDPLDNRQIIGWVATACAIAGS